VTRLLSVAACQMGPVERNQSRAEVVERLIAMLHTAAERGAELAVFPELALTTFFPRWYIEDPDELHSFYEPEMPGPDTKPLFDEAQHLGIGFQLGYAELTPDCHRYNTAILVERNGEIMSRYRKVHLPGHTEYESWRSFQHLERRYFEPGDGFVAHRAFGGIVGSLTCNDRRWPEAYRALGLQGVELVLIGYNTPLHYAPDPGQDALAGFHNNLSMASGAYQNGTWVVGVAKGGTEAGIASLAESQIIAPSGEVVAKATTEKDEVVAAVVDLDRCRLYTGTVFDMDRYRRPDLYGLITDPGSVADHRP